MKLSEVFLRAAQSVASGNMRYPRSAVMHACGEDGNTYLETIPIVCDVFPYDTSETSFDMAYEDEQAVVLGLLFCAEIAKEDE